MEDSGCELPRGQTAASTEDTQRRKAGAHEKNCNTQAHTHLHARTHTHTHAHAHAHTHTHINTHTLGHRPQVLFLSRLEGVLVELASSYEIYLSYFWRNKKYEKIASNVLH